MEARVSSQESKLKKGRIIEVTFFGEHSVVGVVEAVDKNDATIIIGKIPPIWSVTAPRSWIRQGGDRWSLELA